MIDRFTPNKQCQADCNKISWFTQTASQFPNPCLYDVSLVSKELLHQFYLILFQILEKNGQTGTSKSYIFGLTYSTPEVYLNISCVIRTQGDIWGVLAINLRFTSAQDPGDPCGVLAINWGLLKHKIQRNTWGVLAINWGLP